MSSLSQPTYSEIYNLPIDSTDPIVRWATENSNSLTNQCSYFRADVMLSHPEAVASYRLRFPASWPTDRMSPEGVVADAAASVASAILAKRGDYFSAWGEKTDGFMIAWRKEQKI